MHAWLPSHRVGRDTIDVLCAGFFLYRLVYFYHYPAVRVYRSGINGIPLLTARIQNPNQIAYTNSNQRYTCGKDLYRAVMN
jgi:hypothetical protein